MREWQCHKRVCAEKIVSLGDDPLTAVLGLADGTSFAVSDGWADKHKPQIGGYLVQYGDGYLSYSPAAAFESGYTLIAQAPKATS